MRCRWKVENTPGYSTNRGVRVRVQLSLMLSLYVYKKITAAIYRKEKVAHDKATLCDFCGNFNSLQYRKQKFAKNVICKENRKGNFTFLNTTHTIPTFCPRYCIT
jgi:hypothetical protein